MMQELNPHCHDWWCGLFHWSSCQHGLHCNSIFIWQIFGRPTVFHR